MSNKDRNAAAPRALLYLRTASLDEADANIELQRRTCRRTAELHGIEVVGEYVDRGASGLSFERPELQGLLRHLERGNVTRVIATDAARLTRSFRDHARLLLLFHERGVTLVSCAAYTTPSFNHERASQGTDDVAA